MRVIRARNVHQAFPKAIETIKCHGDERDSRAGKVLMVSEPVTTVYENPKEKVIFWEKRDANPFLHLFEGLWMLAGRNDVKFVSQFVPRMSEFSDDGETFHGAYGYRWRNHFGQLVQSPGGGKNVFQHMCLDQLVSIADILTKNPEDRRCILQMWDPLSDLGREGKDFPCNCSVNFQRDRLGRLNIVVFNRSNDIVWGCYGADAVHFAMLQEFMAAAIGCGVGTYTQVSCNWHGYLENVTEYFSEPFQEEDPYESGLIGYHAMVTTPVDQWMSELNMLLDEGPVMGIRDSFLRKVAGPMWLAHRDFRELEAPGKYHSALQRLDKAIPCDWIHAANQWVKRRWKNWLRKNN